jgi:hypothetical protein
VIDAREVLDVRPGIKPGVWRDRFRRLDGRSDDSEVYMNQKPGGTHALKSVSRMTAAWDFLACYIIRKDFHLDALKGIWPVQMKLLL